MLSRYEGETIKITTEDGQVFTGTAESFPSGFGLHEFGRAEESLRLGDTQIFLSDIREIDRLPDAGPEGDPRRYDLMMGSLLEGPYRIVDILPRQVPADADGQFFAVERYYRQPRQLRALRRRFAGILLRLNCYYDMSVSFDSCESWTRNPDPETFAAKAETFAANEFLRAVFPAMNAMIDLEPDDTYMTVYDPGAALLDTLRPLAEAEGLFVWCPPEGGGAASAP